MAETIFIVELSIQ